jgi:hypothetical protein
VNLSIEKKESGIKECRKKRNGWSVYEHLVAGSMARCLLQSDLHLKCCSVILTATVFQHV